MRYFLGIACTVCTFLIGNISGLLIALVVLMAIDMLTGLIAAGLHQEVSSRVGLYGIARKVVILTIVIVANMVDKWVGVGTQLRDITIIFYIVNEFISIAENCGKMGVPLPDAIKKALDSMNTDNKEI